MTTLEIYIILAFAALVHASFQLSVSVMTLMSGHALGKSTSHARVMQLVGAYILGVGVMIMLLLASLALVLQHVLPQTIPALVWAVLSGAVLGIGFSILFFYYRKQRGTMLWIPRSIASYISARAKATKMSGEAFGLGLSTAVGELLFCIAPLAIAAFVLIHASPFDQLMGIMLYVAISILPQLVVAVRIGGGTSVSTIQKWREHNKRFLQFAAGGGLIVLAIHLYTTFVIAHIENGGSWVL